MTTTAEDRINAALAIHKPRWTGIDHYGNTITLCAHDQHPWPCKTVRTLQGDQ